MRRNIKIPGVLKINWIKGMSQLKLALVSGTSRTYISIIENNHSDFELAGLRKILEKGLGKRLEITVK